MSQGTDIIGCETDARVLICRDIRCRFDQPPELSCETDVRVLICRGCCCGTEWKHPTTDHDEQIEAISAVAQTRVVGCVNECAYSNVVIVRAGHGQSVWLGGIGDTAITTALCEWLSAGAVQPPPPHPTMGTGFPRLDE